MGEHTFRFKPSTRTETVARFLRISAALGCADTYHFRFSTTQAEDAQALIQMLNNPDSLSIAVKGPVSPAPETDFTDYFRLLGVEALELLNLTLQSIRQYVDQPLAELTLVKRGPRPSVSIRGQIPRPKNKRDERAYLDYQTGLFNRCFAALGLDRTASVGVSDGSDWAWKNGDKGIVIQSTGKDAGNELGFTTTTSRHGVHRIDFGTRHEAMTASEAGSMFERLVHTGLFKDGKGSCLLWGPAETTLRILPEYPIPVQEISNIFSQDIEADQSLLDALLELPWFDGRITLIRPYTFQKAFYNALKLNFEEDHLWISFSTGMTSENSMNKFRKMLTVKLGEEVDFTG